MKKMLTLVLAFVMVMSLSCSAFAISIDADGNGQLNTRMLDLRITDYVEAKIAADGEELTVSQVKTLTDFAGNEYKLVECSPCGYFIILPESGLTTEYSYLAPSPYLGLTGDLRYAGPTFYYISSGTSDIANMQQATIGADYTHTVLKDEEITISDAIVARCEEINDEYGAAVVAEVRDYLAGISTNLHCTVNSKNLTNALINTGILLGYDYDSWAVPLTNTINQYLDDYNVAGKVSNGIGVVGVSGEIDSHRPVILFGTLYNPQNGNSSNTRHGIVVYNYTTSGSYEHYECHYGWNGYSSVNIWAGDSSFGTNTRYNPYG